MEKCTTYILAHRESIAALITEHGASLPATPEADAIRRHLMDHIYALAGFRYAGCPVDTRALCKDTYALLGDIATAHQAAHSCTSAGTGACPFLKSILARRASMARSGVIF